MPQLPQQQQRAGWAVREAVPMALAPPARDPRRQRFVRANVAVRDRSRPEYALVFEAECFLPGAEQPVLAVRAFSKRQLARAFEGALLSGGDDGEAWTGGGRLHRGAPTDVLGVSFQRENVARDAAVRRWLQGAGKVPPPRREELVKWLLARMFLSRSDVARDDGMRATLGDHWSSGWTLLVGEEAQGTATGDLHVGSGEWPASARADAPHAAGEDTGDDHDGYTRDGAGRPLCDPQPTDESDESPPGYDAASFAPTSPLFRHHSMVKGQAPGTEEEHGADHDVSDSFTGDRGEDQGEPTGDQDAPPLIDEVDTWGSPIAQEGHAVHVQGEKYWEGDAPSGSFSSKVRSGHERPAEGVHAGDASFVPAKGNQRQRIPSPSNKSVFTLEPAALRLRSRSSSLVLEPNEWTEDRRRFEVELTASKCDIEKAKLEKEKAERVAELRTQQLLQRGRKQVERSRQRRRDAEKVKQLIADTLEYHSILLDVGAQIKQTKIASRREQERLTQCMRVAIGRTDKWRKGAVIGPGPLSQRELDLRSTQPTLPVRTVYDLHGRRHSVSEAGKIAAENDFESAMRKIQRLLLDSDKALELFRLYDRDRTGALSYTEFLRLMRERCTTTFTDEQSEAFFRHFDPNRSGEIDYGELLWGFFNRRAFLKRWAQKRRGRSDREVKMLFYRYDLTGRGALSAADFLLALDDLGFRVNDDEAKLLCMKFDANGDGFIDYREFCGFVGSTDADKDEKPTDGEREKISRQSRWHSLASLSSNSNNANAKSRRLTGVNGDREQILAELHELQATQMQIRRYLLSKNS